MAYMLLDAAQERWRPINGHELVTDVLAGARFKARIQVTNDETEIQDEKVAAEFPRVAGPPFDPAEGIQVAIRRGPSICQIP